MNDMTIAPAPVRQQVRVKAAPGRAFEVFTAGMGRWWKPSHSINASPLKDVVIEPSVGGRWFERGEDGRECEWGKVLAWEPPHRLVLAWQIGADWKYDPELMTEVEVRFAADGAGFTRVEFEHRKLERYGDVAAKVREFISSAGGWPALLEAFRNACE